MMNSNNFFNFTIRRLLLVRAERWWVQHSRMNNTKKLLFCRGISYFWGSEPPSSDSYTICCHEVKVSRRGARRTQVQSTKCRHFFSSLHISFMWGFVLCLIFDSSTSSSSEEERRRATGKKRFVEPSLKYIYFVWALSTVMCVTIVERNTHEMNKKEQQFRLHYRFCFRGCWLTC